MNGNRGSIFNVAGSYESEFGVILWGGSEGIVRNACFDLTFDSSGNEVIVFRCGTWENGIWRDGEWRNGLWESGTWQSGTWHDGIWLDGIWLSGTWLDGEWHGGSWKIGIWQCGCEYGEKRLISLNG